jgi:cell division protein FtsB
MCTMGRQSLVKSHRRRRWLPIRVIVAFLAGLLGLYVLRALWALRSTVDRDRVSMAQSLQRLRATSEAAFGGTNEEAAQLKADAAVEAGASSLAQAAREHLARASSPKVTAEDVAEARNLEQAARERLARESSMESSALEPASLGGVEIKPGALPALTAALLQGLSQPGAEEGSPAVLAAVEAELTTLGTLAALAVKSGEDCLMPPELGRVLLLLATRISIGIGLLGKPEGDEPSDPPRGDGGPSQLH